MKREKNNIPDAKYPDALREAYNAYVDYTEDNPVTETVEEGVTLTKPRPFKTAELLSYMKARNPGLFPLRTDPDSLNVILMIDDAIRGQNFTLAAVNICPEEIMDQKPLLDECYEK